VKYQRSKESSFLVVDYDYDKYICHFCNEDELKRLPLDSDSNYIINNGKIICHTMQNSLSGLTTSNTLTIEDKPTITYILSELLGSTLIVGNKSIPFEGIGVSKSSTSIYIPMYYEDGDCYRNYKLYDFDKSVDVNPLTFKIDTVPDSIRDLGFSTFDKWSIDLSRFPVTTINRSKVLYTLWFGDVMADMVFWSEIPNIMFNGLNFMIRMCNYNFNNSKMYQSNSYQKRFDSIKRLLKVKYRNNTPYHAFKVDNIEEYQNNPGFTVITPYDELFLKGMQAITVKSSLGYNLDEVNRVKRFLKREYDKRQLLVFKNKYIHTDVIIPLLRKNPDYCGLVSITSENKFCSVTVETE
jgi:hypothetical protein